MIIVYMLKSGVGPATIRRRGVNGMVKHIVKHCSTPEIKAALIGMADEGNLSSVISVLECEPCFILSHNLLSTFNHRSTTSNYLFCGDF
jgi:hypothetical protein